MHEFVASAERQKHRGVAAMDIAKRILDFGMHAPSVYFPLIVPEAMMVEPTESENRRTLDGYVAILEAIDQESLDDPAVVRGAPYTTAGAPSRRGRGRSAPGPALGAAGTVEQTASAAAPTPRPRRAATAPAPTAW